MENRLFIQQGQACKVQAQLGRDQSKCPGIRRPRGMTRVGESSESRCFEIVTKAEGEGEIAPSNRILVICRLIRL